MADCRVNSTIQTTLPEHLLIRCCGLKKPRCFISMCHRRAYADGNLKGALMEIVVSNREYGREVRCRTCNSPMRLVGKEPHHELSDLVELATYECECGAILAKLHLSDTVVHAFPDELSDSGEVLTSKPN